MNLNNLNFKNIDTLSVFILLIPVFIIIGNSAINLSCFIIILLGISKFFKEIKNYFLVYQKQILILFVFFIINNFFSSDNFLSLRGSLNIIKYILLASILYIWFRNKNNFNLFLFLIIISSTILTLSIYVEFINFLINKNLLNDRYAGLFFDEEVAGSYLAKFLTVTLIIFSLNLKKFKISNLSKIFYIIFIYSGILVTMDRMPFIMISMSLFIFILFTTKINIYHKIISLIISLTVLISIYVISPKIQGKVWYTLSQLGFKNIIAKIETPDEHKPTLEAGLVNKSFYETKWSAHFVTAYKIGENSFLIGNGIKTFRKDCRKEIYISDKYDPKLITHRCSTHPHNIYFELFAETGIIGLFIFLYFHFLVLRKIFLSKEKENKIVSITIMFLLFFPIQTTGSYFSTFNGIFYFINLATVAYISSNKFFKK